MNTIRGLILTVLLLEIFAQMTAIGASVTASGKSPRTEIRLSGDGWKLWRDVKAEWKNDELFLPPVDIAKLPVKPPTGGWRALYSGSEAISVSAPGTVEEYFWDEIHGNRKADESTILGDYLGVSWWWRPLSVPTSAKGKRILLRFENNWLRSEVFVNETLVGYDMVANSAFEIDITDAIIPGEQNTLAVRITDPGGNFIWPDSRVFDWGRYKIPSSHGFGGIQGHVDMRIVDPVYIDNVFIKNLPEMTAINVQTTVQNTKSGVVRGELQIDIAPADDHETLVFSQRYENICLQQGENQIERHVSVPSAMLWHYDRPNLYICKVRIEADALADQDAIRFGFRWFDIAKRGEDDHFVLNGKREFLLSSITWGFWPVNGATPTEELAEKQIRQAKGLHMNMLNFHRHKGQSMVLDKADEIGLLYYAEPGGYRCQDGDDFAFKMARLKWLRMVKEFRNHPSLVIYNMINETGVPPTPRQKQDMLDAHAIDPSRIFTYSSGFRQQDAECKLHMLPYDDRQYTFGWWDPHRACSLGVCADTLYSSPTDYSYHYDDSMRKEILFLGEEGAVGAPPRLQLINDYYRTSGRRNGWDGADYVQWFNAFDNYLKQKGLKSLTVDDVTIGLANTQYYYHGRMIENAKINDLVDGYVINGWECEKMEDHSGIVDSFRNYKGDPGIIRRYTRPVYVAIKARNTVAHVSDTIDADFFIVNGDGKLDGDYTLEVGLPGPAGKVVKRERWPASVSRERLGTLVTEKANFALNGAAGYYTLNARLVDKNGAQQADGMEKLFTVDWKSAKIPAKGAVIEPSNNIRDFMSAGLKIELPPYHTSLGKLDYIVLETSVGTIPDTLFATPDGKPGLKAEYFSKQDSETPVGTRIEPNIRKCPPPSVAGLRDDITVIWTGSITPKESGSYILCGDFAGQLNIWADGQQVMNGKMSAKRKTRFMSGIPLDLEAGTSYEIKVQYVPIGRGDSLELQWRRQLSETECDQILARVANDGATLIVSGNNTQAFAQQLDKRRIVKYNGFMEVDLWWKAGGLFAVKHPLFKGLPQNTGMSWEYQDIAKYEVTINEQGEYKRDFESKRYGLLLEGEEVAGFCTDGHRHKVASTVSVVRHGKGKIVLSCLNFYPYLTGDSKPSNSVKKLLCNYIEYSKDE